MSFEHKMVAIVNKDIDTGIAMNALAHMSIGLGNQVDGDLLRLDDYCDKDGNIYPNISEIPLIVLGAKSGEIRKVIREAREKEIIFTVFLNTMIGDDYQEQLDETEATEEEGLIYYGAVLFGSSEEVQQLTKRLSLYK